MESELRERIEDLIGIRRLQIEEYRGFLKAENDAETVNTLVVLISQIEGILTELQTILDETI
jgi:hypothetical protein